MCSYPIRASYSGRVEGLGMKKELKKDMKTTACLEIISNTGAHFLNLHIDKARKTHVDKQLYLITHFTNLNSRSMVATSSFGSLYFAVHFPTKSNSYKKFPALWLYQFTIYQCINRLNAHVISELRWPHNFPLLH